MNISKHSEEQMIAALKQSEAGRRAEDVAREYGVSKHTICAWKAKYGGMTATEAQEAKQLRDENARLRKLVADLSLDKGAVERKIELVHIAPGRCRTGAWRAATDVCGKSA